MLFSNALRTFPRDPFSGLDRLHREMNRLFSSADVGGFADRFPALNVWTGEGSIVVETDLPGVSPADLEITVLDDVLTIRGERKAPDLKEGEVLHRHERDYGSFERTVQLPGEVDTARVEARHDRGVLTITLPRAEATRPRKVKVVAK